MQKRTSGRHMTKTQKKRAAYNYRYYYFKKYPGLVCGHLWFCSQCHRPIWNKRDVQVDHILALGSGGVNRTINTVAICATCNLRKSDKVGFLGMYVIHGYVSKILEVVSFSLSKAVGCVVKAAKDILSENPVVLVTLVVVLMAFILFFH